MIKNKNIKSLSDEELVILYQKKENQKYIGELYNRYAHLVYGVCLKYLKNVEESQDTLMQVFEKLMHTLKKHKVENFKPWLYQLSRNECLMKLRKSKNDITKLPDTQEWESDYELRLTEKLEKEIEYENLEKAIQELKPKQKECIELFYLKKMSYQQIENQTNYSVKEVKSAIQNGKRNLKLILEKLNI